MPTPVIYEGAAIDPFAHVGEFHRSQDIEVFYATNRAEVRDGDGVGYENSLDTELHLGSATIRVGEPGAPWKEVVRRSLGGDVAGEDATPLTVAAIGPMAAIPVVESGAENGLPAGVKAFVDGINAELDRAEDKEVMVYVHGTKVDFANSVSLTAEVDHFAGRDFVGVAFAWPSHQNILSYLVGVDVRRAWDSSAALRRLLVLLAEHTDAEQINVLSYSAGGRVTSKALYELRESLPELSGEALRERFRLGSVVFAAADVPVDVFLERLADISPMAEQVVITVTDDDNALKAGKRFMGGAARAGTVDAELREEAFVMSEHLANVEIIDVSRGKEVRGFDITGHHYWYRHPWTSSDMVFLMRTDLPAEHRGLSATEQAGVWFLSENYPARVRRAAEKALDGQW